MPTIGDLLRFKKTEDVRITLPTERKRWMSKMPICCDVCEDGLEDGFIDGRMKISGKWAIMCLRCFMVYGVGLGLGQGQQYDAQGVKTAG